MLVSKALTLETAGKVASMTYIQILFAFVSEWIIWGVLPTLTSFFGTLLVCSSLVIIALFSKPKNVARTTSVISLGS